MEYLTIVATIKKDISLRWLECFFMALASQTNIDFKVVLRFKNPTLKQKELINFLENFSSVNVSAKSENYILRHSDSKYIVFITSQDIIYPNFGYVMTQYLESSNADIVYGTTFLCHISNDLIIQSKVKYKSTPYIKEGLFQKLVYLPSCVYRTKFLKKNKIRYSKFVLYFASSKTTPVYYERDVLERWELYK